MDEDANFPRGNIKTTKKEFFRDVENIFSQRNNEKLGKSKKQKQPSTVPLNKGVNDQDIFPTTADALTYEHIQEGMLILACIRAISPLAVEVELPGKRSGKIQITRISDCYTKFLQQKLQEKDIGEEKDLARLNNIFHIGEYVPTKVIQKRNTEKGIKISLSMNPVDIHADWSHRILQQDLLLWAAVESELDHGYQLNAGIKNCRIFLPHENVKEGSTFVIGQPLWCSVQKCDINVAASTVIVSNLEKHMKPTVQKLRINLHHLIPGMQVNFTVTKVAKYGLQGEFMNGCYGYINEGYLATPLEHISKYKEGQILKAHLLCIQPTTKLAYLSLRNLKSVAAGEYAVGTILQSKIISRTAGGVNVKLPNNEKGFVSFKRIARMVSRRTNLEDIIANKYSQGSSHQCRILDYQHFEQVYICTFEQTLLKEKFFTTNDIKFGELVTAKVKCITKEGLIVQMGKIKAFIHNIHLSNVAYSENIKKKFSVGQTLQARVWNIDDKGVHLTHKQAFLASDLCLSEVDDSIMNQQYPGLVAKVNKKGILVIFYGGVRGWLSNMYLRKLYGEESINVFYEGQVIMTTVTNKGKYGLSLSLNVPSPTPTNVPSPTSPKKVHRIGEYLDGVVTNVTDEGLEIEISNNIKGFVPVNHLSSSISLTPLLLKTYSVGNIIKDLLCISDGNIPMLSIREAVAYQKHNLNVHKLEDLEIGSLLRCSYESCYGSGIIVTVPLKPRVKSLKIPFKELSFDAKLVNGLKSHQTIIAKVTKIEGKFLQVTARVEEVFSWDCKKELDNFEQYLSDVKQIQSHFLKNKLPLGKLKLGQRVQCIIQKVNKVGCLVTVEDGNIQGLVHKELCPENVKPGQKLVGVILWINYKDQYADIACTETIINKVNPIQDGIINKPLDSAVHADILIKHNDYVVAVMRNQNTNRQLIFLPTRIHENSFSDLLTYNILQEIKVIISRKVNEKYIGIDKKVIHELVKIKRKCGVLSTNRKRKQKEDNVSANKRIRLESNNKITKNKELSSKISDEENNTDTETEIQLENSESRIVDDDEDEMDVDNSEDEDSDTEMETNDQQESDNSEASDSEIEENVAVDEEEVNSEVDDFDEENEETENNSEEEDHLTVNSRSHNQVDNSIDTDNEEDKPSLNRNEQSQKNFVSIKSVSPALPGMKNFFDNENLKKVKLAESSDDEVTEEQTNSTKKKKLTPAERRELARQEEERLRKKEIEIADSTAEPQSDDQFNMLLTGKPNCSELWAKYIAYCVSNAEIHKARSIAQTALTKINLKEAEERYNIWIILLNLENNYGDKESFNKVFVEAVRCNDDLRIYLDVISMFADSQKYTEMEEKVKKIKSKYKQDPKMWLSIVRMYYKSGQYKEARNLQNTALKTIDVKSKHIDLIVQFGIMEFQYGEKNHAEALFESILQHAPKRIDVWSTYVDQVIKQNDIEGARRILERAVSQSIPAKKMKTLFKKYKDLETKYGTQKNIDHVVNLARKYAGLTEG